MFSFNLNPDLTRWKSKEIHLFGNYNWNLRERFFTNKILHFYDIFLIFSRKKFNKNSKNFCQNFNLFFFGDYQSVFETCWETKKNSDNPELYEWTKNYFDVWLLKNHFWCFVVNKKIYAVRFNWRFKELWIEFTAQFSGCLKSQRNRNLSILSLKT